MARSGKRSSEPLLKGQAEMLVSAWPTPASRDWKGANSADHLENGTGRLHLDQLPNFVEHLWSTPRSSDGEKGSPNQAFGAGGVPLPALTGAASSLPDHATSTHGGKSLEPRRVLNPLFVSWLMGWPRPASTGFGFSETESFRFKQLMRFALSHLDWPREAPPAQTDLFA